MGDSGTNWSTEEQIQLCDSWARKTVCPITGKQITSSKLWEKVHADYVQYWQDPPISRTPQALQSQFRMLKKILKDWHNAQMTSHNRIHSGTNKMDEMNQTQGIFMKNIPRNLINLNVGRKLSTTRILLIHHLILNHRHHIRQLLAPKMSLQLSWMMISFRRHHQAPCQDQWDKREPKKQRRKERRRKMQQKVWLLLFKPWPNQPKLLLS
ncbi:uncharacterized protein LOC133727798 [Rosa rugosa]|uniref:uncharacterized protein LOC133727798 n=1 Tax=Rosa rugosa TaxID=74645 RepID=UPI002B406255|nr:uncharacterized protein LOC133727798 [Rosa rugosa]